MSDLSNLSICFLAGTLAKGGAERQLYYVVETLKQLGATVLVLTLGHDEFWEEPFRQLGVEVKWVGANKSRLGRSISVCWAVRKFGPDICQSQHFYANLYVALAGRLLNLADVGAIRGNLINEIADVGWLGKPSLLLPRHLVVNSYAARDTAVKMGVSPSRLHYVPNVVDCVQFSPASDHKPSDLTTILTVGRLHALKRVDLFISILAGIYHAQPEINFHGIIVGDGPERSNLESLVSSQNVPSDLIEFRGEIDKVEDAYREADIFILTSEHEGTPNVLLEAMASGLATVATRVGDAENIISSGHNGILIDVDDFVLTVEVVRNLVLKPDLRHKLGAAARSYVSNYHSPAVLPKALAALYGAN